MSLLCPSDWLLLQTPRLLLQEGDPLVLRCHRWKNWPLFKITFFQDGTSKRYSPANSTFFIPHANVNHSGKYHCSGFIGKKRHMSQPVSITVQGGGQGCSRSFRPGRVGRAGINGDLWDPGPTCMLGGSAALLQPTPKGAQK